MNRRSFFSKALGVAVGLVAGPTVVKAAEKPKTPEYIIYEGVERYTVGTLEAESLKTKVFANIPRNRWLVSWRFTFPLSNPGVMRWRLVTTKRLQPISELSY